MLEMVSLRVVSVALSPSRMAELLAVAPTRVVELGSPVSSRRPDGARHWANMWLRDSGVTGDDLAAHVTALRPAIEGLVRVFVEDPEVTADVTLMIEAKPLGASMDVEPDTIRLLASAGCGIWIDAYDSDESEGDAPPR
jgi:hypothetical protein